MEIVHHQLADPHHWFQQDWSIGLIDQFQGDLTCESCINKSGILYLDAETTHTGPAMHDPAHVIWDLDDLIRCCQHKLARIEDGGLHWGQTVGVVLGDCDVRTILWEIRDQVV
jgi:hypothetical protein